MRKIPAVILFALAVIVAIWGATFERLRYERDALLAAAVKDGANLVMGLEHDVTETLRNANQAMVFVRHEYLQEGRALDRFALVDADALNRSIMEGIRIADSSGKVVIGTARGSNIADRDFFREHLAQARDHLFIGQPILDEVTGKWVMELSRRISAADGSFAGVISVTMDPSILAQFFPHASLDPGSAVMIVGLDGVSRARRVGGKLAFAEDYRKSTLVSEVAKNPVGSFLSRGVVDGVPRFISYRRVAPYGLVVSLGLSKAEVLAPLEHHRLTYYAFASLASALVLLLAAALLASLVRQKRAHMAVVASEARVRASEAQLRQITDAVPVMIAFFDADKRIRFHNRAYEEWFGLTREAIHGRSHEELIGIDDYNEVRGRVQEALDGYPVRLVRSEKDAAGETRDLDVHYFPCYGSDDEKARVIGYYALAIDITEVKRVDRMKSEFVSTVSHELRTPLTSIRGSLGLIAGGVAGPLSDAAASLVNIAKNNCERLVRLINDILDIEKIESGKMRFNLQVGDLEGVLQQALGANQGFANEHGVRFDLDATGKRLPVNIDSDRLIQVITNLLSNAVKFSPAGGTVDVAVSCVGDRARVEVRDRGPGIPVEFQERIFQKFSQADSSDARQKGGTGLGLNISKAIVERMGGAIGFTTAIGKGTTFFFELPIRFEAAPEAEAPRAAPPEPLGPRPCVLVCEDEPDIARLIGMMLERAGYATETAPTAARARALLAANSYAAMTVDLRLPDECGISLIRSLRRNAATRDLPIIVVSASSEEGRIQVNSERLSVSSWLEKPIDENRLVASIRFAVDGVGERWPRILHVEDDPDIRRIAAAIGRDFALFDFAASLQEARDRLKQQPYDLVLLDMGLPDGSGWSLVGDLETDPGAPPVVVFAAGDVDPVDARRVSAVLAKSRTSNEALVETLQRALRRSETRIPLEA